MFIKGIHTIEISTKTLLEDFKTIVEKALIEGATIKGLLKVAIIDNV